MVFPNSKEKANGMGEVPISAKLLRKREKKIDSRNAGKQAWCGTQQTWKEDEKSFCEPQGGCQGSGSVWDQPGACLTRVGVLGLDLPG